MQIASQAPERRIRMEQQANKSEAFLDTRQKGLGVTMPGAKSAHTHFRPKIRMRASFIPKAWRSPECSASGFRYRENVGQIADWQIESPSGPAASGSDQTRIT